jgi:hypothetical protein
VGPELVHGKNHGQKFLLRCGVVELGAGQCLTGIRYGIVLLILALTEHCSDGIVTRIAHDLERETPIGGLYDGCGNECLLEGIEG